MTIDVTQLKAGDEVRYRCRSYRGYRGGRREAQVRVRQATILSMVLDDGKPVYALIPFSFVSRNEHWEFESRGIEAVEVARIDEIVVPVVHVNEES